MSDATPDGEKGGDVSSLVRLAGARPVPPPLAVAAARANVRAAWRAGIQERRARAWRLAAAAGACVAAVAIVAVRGAREGAGVHAPAALSAEVVGRLDAATGLVERRDGSGWARLALGDALATGTRVRTVAGGAGLRAPDGRSIRMAPVSRVRWDAPERLTLEAGTVYVDSGRAGAAAGGGFEVRTAWGVVREAGTQFEVRLEVKGLRVRVREGKVAVACGSAEAPAAGGPEQEASGGIELRVDAQGAERRAFPVHGPDWSWVLALAPGFEMDGRTLHELVAWASREAGWELRYTDAESERRSREARLHGSVRGLRPDEAVSTVIPSTGLRFRIGDGVLRLGTDGIAAEAVGE